MFDSFDKRKKENKKKGRNFSRTRGSKGKSSKELVLSKNVSIDKNY
jgi:hypothetical protein